MICFVESELNYLKGLIFDPENGFSYIYLIRYETSVQNINLIKSPVSLGKKYCFICFSQTSSSFAYSCLIFNFVYHTWSKLYKFIGYSCGEEYYFEIYNLNNNDEYLVYIPLNTPKYHLYIFDNT